MPARIALPRWFALPVAVVLVCVVALASRSSLATPVPLAFDTTQLVGIMKVVGYVIEFVGIVGLFVAGILYRTKALRSRSPDSSKQKADALPWWAQAIGLGAVVVVVVGQAAILVSYLFEILHALWERINGGGGGGGLSGLAPQLAGRDIPSLLIATAIVVGLMFLMLAIAVRWRIQDRRFALAGASGGESAMAAAIDVSLDALRREPDARRAVIAAYAAMERALSAAGMGRRRWEAPLEYVHRVLTEHTRAPEQVRTITHLFQVAKFSHHPVDDAMRSEAIDALERIRAATEPRS